MLQIRVRFFEAGLTENKRKDASRRAPSLNRRFVLQIRVRFFEAGLTENKRKDASRRGGKREGDKESWLCMCNVDKSKREIRRPPPPPRVGINLACGPHGKPETQSTTEQASSATTQHTNNQQNTNTRTNTTTTHQRNNNTPTQQRNNATTSNSNRTTNNHTSHTDERCMLPQYTTNEQRTKGNRTIVLQREREPACTRTNNAQQHQRLC